MLGFFGTIYNYFYYTQGSLFEEKNAYDVVMNELMYKATKSKVSRASRIFKLDYPKKKMLIRYQCEHRRLVKPLKRPIKPFKYTIIKQQQKRRKIIFQPKKK